MLRFEFVVLERGKGILGKLTKLKSKGPMLSDDTESYKLYVQDDSQPIQFPNWSRPSKFHCPTLKTRRPYHALPTSTCRISVCVPARNG